MDRGSTRGGEKRRGARGIKGRAFASPPKRETFSEHHVPGCARAHTRSLQEEERKRREIYRLLDVFHRHFAQSTDRPTGFVPLPFLLLLHQKLRLSAAAAAAASAEDPIQFHLSLFGSWFLLPSTTVQSLNPPDLPRIGFLAGYIGLGNQDTALLIHAVHFGVKW